MESPNLTTQARFKDAIVGATDLFLARETGKSLMALRIGPDQALSPTASGTYASALRKYLREDAEIDGLQITALIALPLSEELTEVVVSFCLDNVPDILPEVLYEHRNSLSEDARRSLLISNKFRDSIIVDGHFREVAESIIHESVARLVTKTVKTAITLGFGYTLGIVKIGGASAKFTFGVSAAVAAAIVVREVRTFKSRFTDAMLTQIGGTSGELYEEVRRLLWRKVDTYMQEHTLESSESTDDPGDDLERGRP